MGRRGGTQIVGWEKEAVGKAAGKRPRAGQALRNAGLGVRQSRVRILAPPLH